jgi:hypothetical protein
VKDTQSINAAIINSNYNENQVDEWIDKNFDKVDETGYGWKYPIHTCIKEDNPQYYEAMSKSYYTMKKEFKQNNGMAHCQSL